MKITPNNTLIVFALLMYIPYLYPQEYFLYNKVYNVYIHTIICIMILFVGYVSTIIGRSYAKKFGNVYFVNFSKSTSFLFTTSKIVILVSCFGNLFIAYSVYKNGLQSIGEFDLVAAKSQGVGISGFMFISQLYLFFLPYLIKYGFEKNKNWKLYVMILLLCILIRSILYSERLALIEFLTFLLTSLHTLKLLALSYRKIFIFFICFIVLFVIAELSRQFYAQYILTNADIDINFALNWAIERYMAYYADTTNKFYVILDNNLLYVTHNYLFPIEQIISKFNISLLENDFRLQEFGIVNGYTHTNFNNINGLSILLMDFGYFGFILYAIIFFVGGFIFQIYLKTKDIVIFSIYPAVVITNLEFTRILYFNSTRLLIPLFLFFLILSLNYVLHATRKR